MVNGDRLTTAFGILAAVAELAARTGMLGEQSIYADGVAAVAFALLGIFSKGRYSEAAEGEVTGR